MGTAVENLAQLPQAHSLGALPPSPGIQHMLGSVLGGDIISSQVYSHFPAQILNSLQAKPVSFTYS